MKTYRFSYWHKTQCKLVIFHVDAENIKEAWERMRCYISTVVGANNAENMVLNSVGDY